jgi:hypothetical protein
MARQEMAGIDGSTSSAAELGFMPVWDDGVGARLLSSM